VAYVKILPNGKDLVLMCICTWLDYVTKRIIWNPKVFLSCAPEPCSEPDECT